MSKKFKSYRSDSNRLKGYDYSLCGAYFVTITTNKFLCLFGTINNDVIVLNSFGEIAKDEWLRIPEVRPYVIIDEFVIMPNHIHGIIISGVPCNPRL